MDTTIVSRVVCGFSIIESGVLEFRLFGKLHSWSRRTAGYSTCFSCIQGVLIESRIDRYMIKDKTNQNSNKCGTRYPLKEDYYHIHHKGSEGNKKKSGSNYVSGHLNIRIVCQNSRLPRNDCYFVDYYTDENLYTGFNEALLKSCFTRFQRITKYRNYFLAINSPDFYLIMQVGPAFRFIYKPDPVSSWAGFHLSIIFRA